MKTYISLYTYEGIPLGGIILTREDELIQKIEQGDTEAAAYFSSVKLLIAKLMLIGAGDVSLLFGIFITAVIKTSLQAGTVFLFTCFPFLLVNSVSLFMLGHFTYKKFLTGSITLCSSLILVCAVIPEQFVRLFQQSFSVGWTVILIFLLAFCIQQFRYILYCSSYAEMQVSQ